MYGRTTRHRFVYNVKSTWWERKKNTVKVRLKIEREEGGGGIMISESVGEGGWDEEVAAFEICGIIRLWEAKLLPLWASVLLGGSCLTSDIISSVPMLSPLLVAVATRSPEPTQGTTLKTTRERKDGRPELSRLLRREALALWLEIEVLLWEWEFKEDNGSKSEALDLLPLLRR